MQATRYQALFATAGRPATQEQRLLMDLLYYLDDRHLPVAVSYHSRLPRWVKSSLLVSSFFYVLKLIGSRPSVVLVDFALSARVLLAMLCCRRLQRHRFILIVQGSLSKTSTWVLRAWQRLLAGMIFRAADGILASSWELLADLTRLEKISTKVKFLPNRGFQPALAAAGLLSAAGGISRPAYLPAGLETVDWRLSLHNNHSRGLRKRIFDSIFEFSSCNHPGPG